ncbi:prepilin-type N-terminal cleavage/methylation domain-containing protein [Oceanobacter mangrovi]|uniref:prepilin-type N-terminal cleavage/methylation domain-containing protein n=1 Tax=Oceanobacter mangrovi TaxID=2862510 RepID=UPI001C8DE244|nr:prepilin-type N-terminal cleavage/methylation domain-containing protein [Oceanobacter mangrovi]
MKRNGKPNQPQRGFGLVEIIVTVGITTIGLVGLVALMLESDRSAQDSGSRALAMTMVEDISNRIFANPDGIANYDSGGVVSCSSSPSTRCAAYYNGTAQVDAASCTPEEMAAFDLWDVACPAGVVDSSADFTRSGNADFLPNPQLTVEVSSGLGEGATSNQVSITVTWDVRTSGTDSSGNEVYNNSNDITSRKASLTSEFSIEDGN